MEPEGSLPHSTQTVIGPYPVPDQSSPFPISLPVLQGPVYIIFLSTPVSSKRSPHQILYSPLLCPILVTCPAHLIRLNHPNNIFWGIQIFMFLIIFPCYLVPLWPKYLRQHPIPEHPQPVWQRFTPTKNNRQIILLYILIFIYLDGKLEEKRFCTEQFLDFSLLPILSSMEFWFVRFVHKCMKRSTLSKHLLSRKSLCYYVMYLYTICEILHVVQQSQTWRWCQAVSSQYKHLIGVSWKQKTQR